VIDRLALREKIEELAAGLFELAWIDGLA